jgi:hypothetical protein
MRDAALLRDQLSAPTERAQWVSPPTPDTFRVRFVDCTHVLLALVSWPRTNHWPELIPAAGSQTTFLQPLPTGGGRSTLSAPAPGPETTPTHLLVMGWTRVPPPPSFWERRPYDQPRPIDTRTLGWTLPSDELDPTLAQEAIRLLWLQARSSVEYALLKWPEQA